MNVTAPVLKVENLSTQYGKVNALTHANISVPPGSIVTITALSRRVRLNECYLKTAFRRITGQTIAQYLRHLRMRHARRLIEDTRASVLHTAAFVGYSNPSHFASAFKAVYGIAPSRLKQ